MDCYSDVAIDIINDMHTDRLDYQTEYLPLIDAATRLSEFESTGAEPERVAEVMDVVKDIPIEHLQNLMEASARIKSCDFIERKDVLELLKSRQKLWQERINKKYSNKKLKFAARVVKMAIERMVNNLIDDIHEMPRVGMQKLLKETIHEKQNNC